MGKAGPSDPPLERWEKMRRLCATRQPNYQPLPMKPSYVITKNKKMGELRRLLDQDCDEVYKNLYIGCQKTMLNFSYLKALGITHVVIAVVPWTPLNGREYSETFCTAWKNRFKFAVVDEVEDNFDRDSHKKENIPKRFYECNDFILDALLTGGKVFVAGCRGIGGTTTVIAFLMMKLEYPMRKAFSLILKTRPILMHDYYYEDIAHLEDILCQESEGYAAKTEASLAKKRRFSWLKNKLRKYSLRDIAKDLKID